MGGGAREREWDERGQRCDGGSEDDKREEKATAQQ